MPQASMNTRWLSGPLPDHPVFERGIRRAPRRESALRQTEKELAVRNALRPRDNRLSNASTLTAIRRAASMLVSS